MCLFEARLPIEQGGACRFFQELLRKLNESLFSAVPFYRIYVYFTVSNGDGSPKSKKE